MTRPRGGGIDSGRLQALLAGRDEGLESLQRDTRDLLARLFVAIKLALVYDTNNDAMHAASEKMAAAANKVHRSLEAAVELTFLPDGLYLNKLRIKLDLGGFDQAEYLYTVWSWLGIGELTMLGTTSPHDWLEMLGVFQQAVGPGGDRTLLRSRTFERLQLRPPSGGPAVLAVARASERLRALRAYASLVVTLEEIIGRLGQKRRVGVARVKRVVQELISVVAGNEDLLLAITHLKRHKETVAHHLANTTILVVILGRRLELGRKPLCDLAVQAALHDLGLAFVTIDDGDDVTAAAGTIQKLVHLSGASDALIPRVVASWEVHKWLRPLHPDASEVLSPGAAGRIIAVAHAFDLLTRPGDHRPALLADEALRVLVAEAGHRYDQQVVKMLVNAVGVYPVGSLLALSSGELAVVLCSPPDPGADPGPRVKIIRDAAGVFVPGFIVDLAGQRGHARQILRVVGEDEVNVNTPAFFFD